MVFEVILIAVVTVAWLLARKQGDSSSRPSVPVDDETRRSVDRHLAKLARQEVRSQGASKGTGRKRTKRKPRRRKRAARPVTGESPSVPLVFSADSSATMSRIDLLDRYMAEHVLGPAGFCCAHHSKCRSSTSGRFFEGQLHHVGNYYDLTLNGSPFRIVVVGQEYGNGPAGVSREIRSHDVVVLAGQKKRFKGGRTHPARNPHMRGTTSLLRLMLGRQAGSDYGGEFVELDGGRVHVFEAFALVDYLLCSAIAGDESDTGSKRGRSTETMRKNCGRHFAKTIQVLEPTVVVAQGKSVRRWMNPLITKSAAFSDSLERVQLAGQSCLLATFTHPSVRDENGWGANENQPYLLEVVAPTVNAIHGQVIST